MTTEHPRPLEAGSDESAREHRLPDGTTLIDQGITTRLNAEGTDFDDHRKDAIYHVAKHFLCRKQRWQTTLPRFQSDHQDRPVTVRAALGVPDGEDPNEESDVSLWLPPKRSMLLAVARRSYFGAILRGIEESKIGPAGALKGKPSPAWVEQSDGAVAGVVAPGICVKVQPSDPDRFEFLTAYRRSALPTTGKSVAGGKAWNKLFQATAAQWLLVRRREQGNRRGSP